jgi:hypothetical protein
MIRRIDPTESQIQCAIVEWANVTSCKCRHFSNPNNKNIGDFLFAIPNGGSRNIAEAVRLKKEGVKKGVTDLFLAIPIMRHGYMVDFYLSCGLWLEAKTKKGKVSTEQKNWMSLMKDVGYPSVIFRSVEEGIQAIKDYLGML